MYDKVTTVTNLFGIAMGNHDTTLLGDRQGNTASCLISFSDSLSFSFSFNYDDFESTLACISFF